MNKEKDDLIFIKHILNAIEDIETYSKGLSKEKFEKNKKSQDAIIRKIEIIGEAAKNVSQNFILKHPNIPWKESIRTRDKLIHGYFGIDLNIVWMIIEDELPKFKKEINKIFNESNN